MRRGDVVTVAVSGDFGKPRPAVIVQTDALPAEHGSVVVCQMTTTIETAPDFRVTVEPSSGNGLQARSQIMADKPVTVRRERIGGRIGALGAADAARLNAALAFVLGLAD
ncbi:type II toxin-antitoxin system PemK/MazF family toxin [Thalassobaculum sp.]|uniref:type II toxin-antitoxin system PemK/MazF family toxin n=1 Tax=Thalassobaculum sp. TaxID=2022740 RepID=UPI0032EBCE11